MHWRTLLLSLFVAVVSIATGCRAHAAPVRQDVQPIYALQGELREVTGQIYDTELLGDDGRTYALFAATPEVERQLLDLRSQGPGAKVKIWGDYYPQGLQSTGPEILVSAVQAAAPPTPATPAAGTSPMPLAVGRFEYVNLRAGPGNDYPIIGTIVLGQQCPIIGRNESGSWVQLACSDNLVGWVGTNVVEIQGDTSQVPPVGAPPPEQPTPTPTPTPAVAVFYNWQTSYYANRDLAGTPVAQADVANIDFDWGEGSPLPQVPADNFSIRFQRNLSFAPGNYRFFLRMDDGARLWLDGQLILDEWREGAVRDASVDRSLSDTHNLQLDYFESTGLASVRFSFAEYRNRDDWEASYYNTVDLSGNPELVQIEPRGSYPLDRDWGTGSPVPGVIGNDFWSARWRGRFFFESGNYVFRVRSDDGVRIFIDGRLILNDWIDGYRDIDARADGVSRSEHEVVVEFYERTGNALVQIWWYRDTSAREQ